MTDSKLVRNKLNLPASRGILDIICSEFQDENVGEMSEFNDCPAEQVLLDFVGGLLEDTARRQLETHLAQCSLCRETCRFLNVPQHQPIGGDDSVPLADEEDSSSEESEVELPAGEDSSPSHGSEVESADSEDSPPLEGVEVESPDGEAFDETKFDLRLLDAANDESALGRMGKYDIVEVIGCGGMAVVFTAYDEALRRTVAIKVLNRRLSDSATARRRFIREARAAAAVSHNNVVTIHSVDEHRHLPFLVMEYISGCSLRDRVRAERQLDPIEALRISAQIAAGLAAAHAQGVVHRDIKPGNIMLEDGVARVKIADFGLARAAAIDNVELTSREFAVGTPAYMSPEQVRGDEVDHRTDLFALGCVMYAMLAGHSPFHGKSTLDTARRVAEFEPARLGELNNRAPAFYCEVVSRLLRKKADDRYQSAAEVAEILKRQLTTINQTPTDQLSTLLYTRLPWKPAARRSWISLSIVACVVGLFAIAFSYFWLRNDDTPVGKLPGGHTVITVAHSGQADCRTIGEALRRAEPGTTVQVLDSSVYRETLSIRDPQRLRELTLEATADPPAMLATIEDGGSVMRVHDAAGLTVRGFRVEAPPDQPAICMTGRCRGVVFEKLVCKHPPESESVSIINIRVSDQQPDDEPICVRDSQFQCPGPGQSIWVGTDTEPIWNLRIEGNRFECQETHVAILRPVRRVTLTHNIFVGGQNGINLRLAETVNGSVPEDSLRIVNNTFVDTRYWLGFLETVPAHVAFATVCNNLVLGSERIQGPPNELVQAAAEWSFRSNFWEPNEWTSHSLAGGGHVAELVNNIELLSRDPTDADFVQPPDGSPLFSAGCGGDLPTYIGARGPRAGLK